MGDEKLKQELLYMVAITSKYDITKMEVVEGILRLENERRILDSVFGRRFKSRIFDIAAGVEVDGKCVICGQPATNKIICEHCMSTVSGSEYAHSKLKNNKIKNKFNFDFVKKYLKKINIFALARSKKIKNTDQSEIKVAEKNAEDKVEEAYKAIVVLSEPAKKKKIISGVISICLFLILLFQLWILKLWQEIPDVNPLEEAKVSTNESVAVSSQDDAMKQLALDFPESEGYTLTFGRKDRDYVGRFLLDKGECCEEVEEQLTEEQRYDYFFSENVYIFYISYQADYVSKVGLAEINDAGNILVMGSFNDGRNPEYHYKYR